MGKVLHTVQRGGQSLPLGGTFGQSRGGEDQTWSTLSIRGNCLTFAGALPKAATPRYIGIHRQAIWGDLVKVFVSPCIERHWLVKNRSRFGQGCILDIPCRTLPWIRLVELAKAVIPACFARQLYDKMPRVCLVKATNSSHILGRR